MLENFWTSVSNCSWLCVANTICDCSIRVIGTEKYILLIVSLIGFVFFDGVYVAAVMNYAIQSELNISLLQSVRRKVKNRKYHSMDSAIKVSLFMFMTCS